MVNVGAQYFLGAIALSGGLIAHNWEVNNIDSVVNVKAYIDALPKYDKFLAEGDEGKVLGLTFLAAFLLTIGFLSIPAVGPYLALAAGAALVLDLFKVKRIKKSLLKAADIS